MEDLQLKIYNKFHQFMGFTWMIAKLVVPRTRVISNPMVISWEFHNEELRASFNPVLTLGVAGGKIPQNSDITKFMETLWGCTLPNLWILNQTYV